MRTIAALALILACAGAALADEMKTPMKPNSGFDRMKSLAGAWQGKSKDGKTVKVIYALVADGSALMETLEPAGETMITMYYPDGSRVMMTHYCSAHNQPRMRTESAGADAGSLTFKFVDATNMVSPSDGHMEQLVVGFVDHDHFTQEWTFRANDKSQVEAFTFQRAR